MKTCACATRLAGGRALVPGRRRAQGRALRRPCSRPSACATWAVEPHRGVAHGAIQGGGWLPDRLAFRPLRRARQGGAGLVYTEMTCVSPRGASRRAAPGLYAPEHEAAWRAVRFRPCRDRREDLLSDRAFGAQGLDPAGLGRDGCAAARGGQLAGDEASPLPWSAGNQVPGDGPRRYGHGPRSVRGRRRNGRARGLRHDRAARRARLSLSSFSRRCRTSARTTYGGSLENRMRYPLEVFDAMRAVWPEDQAA